MIHDCGATSMSRMMSIVGSGSSTGNDDDDLQLQL